MRIVFVHGACVRDGAWWWHRVAELLDRDGLPSTAPPLPSCGETGRQPDGTGPSLTDDAAAVREHLAASAEPTVVVAHSYGGMVVSEAAAGLQQVQHLLFITSLLPEVGQSLASLGDGSPAPHLDVRPDGTFGVRADTLAGTFLQDCDVETIEQATTRLSRQSVAATTTAVRAAAWHDVPSTYLLCERDNGTPPPSNASTPPGPAPSWRSTPTTIPSYLNRGPSRTSFTISPETPERPRLFR
jgi:pimeloyl-ACP methyl ester carboxylesterase